MRYDIGDTVEYTPHGGGTRRVVVTARAIERGRPCFDGYTVPGRERVWGYDSQITRVIPAPPVTYSCGYCDGVAHLDGTRFVHSADGDRVAPAGPGDYVSARHNRAGTPVLSVDLIEVKASVNR